MNRNEISGFTVRFFSLFVEVVTIKHIPRVFAFGKHHKTLRRLEI
jgi:hypothetical protein